MQRGGVILNDCAAPFHIRELENEGLPAPPTCLSGWQGRKRTCVLVKEEAEWEDREI